MFSGYRPAAMQFLLELRANNRREWFEAHRADYEREILEPSLAFIEDFAPLLSKVSKRVQALPKRVGGSLMRIHKDTRFSKDKAPYKTNIGLQFRHESGKDVHAPGFYIHIEPGEVFLGAGTWHPEAEPLKLIRTAIAQRPADWKKAVGDPAFKKKWNLDGDSLSRPPKGFDPDHPLIEDIKRKDFIAIMEVGTGAIEKRKFLEQAQQAFASATPLMRFLCKSLGQPF